MFSIIQKDEKLRTALSSNIRKACSNLIKDQSILSEEFIWEVMFIQLLMKTNGFHNSDVNKESLNKLTTLCVNCILDEKSPIMSILKLRTRFRRVIQERDFVPEQVCSSLMSEHILDVKLRLESLLKAILNVAHTNDRETLTSVYNKIVFYIILNAGLGTPDKPGVVNETRAALGSVFHVYAVKPFMKKQEDEKRNQLEQLTNIVMGIRLFYWHHGECGEGIEDVPGALVKGINKSIHDLEKRIMEIHSHLQKYEHALWHHYNIYYDTNAEERKEFHTFSDSCISNNFNPDKIEDVKLLKTTINMFNDYKRLLNDIIKILKYAQNEVQRIIREFHDAMVDIQKFTKFKNKYIVTNYVPTDIVVQKFTHVASLWKMVWKHLVTVHGMNDLEEKLNQIVSEARLPSPEMVRQFLEDVEQPNERNRQYREHIQENMITNRQCKVIEYKIESHLKFHGFSTLFLLSEGLIVPANLSIGIIQYNNDLYSFSSPTEAYVFCQNPDKFLLNLIHILHQCPELIDFFQINDTLINSKGIEEVECEDKIVTAATQTELHPIKQHIDKNYHCNAYELMRRHWKQTRSFLNCENKSTRTCYLSDSSTQTYDMRTVSTQEFDKATSVPRVMTYVYGLRGYNNNILVKGENYVPLLTFEH